MSLRIKTIPSTSFLLKFFHTSNMLWRFYIHWRPSTSRSTLYKEDLRRSSLSRFLSFWWSSIYRKSPKNSFYKRDRKPEDEIKGLPWCFLYLEGCHGIFYTQKTFRRFSEHRKPSIDLLYKRKERWSKHRDSLEILCELKNSWMYFVRLGILVPV